MALFHKTFYTPPSIGEASLIAAGLVGMSLSLFHLASIALAKFSAVRATPHDVASLVELALGAGGAALMACVLLGFAAVFVMESLSPQD